MNTRGRWPGAVPPPIRSQSTCPIPNCPHADGRRVVCKHMVALFFTAFPEEAEEYIEEVEENKREEDRRREEHYAALRSYVKSLSKRELQEQLFEALSELEEMGCGFDW